MLTGAGFVLAGGRSSRMGKEKALLVYRGQTLLEKACATLVAVGLEVQIVVSDRQHLGQVQFPVLPDLIAGLGPLGGLFTALQNSRSERNCFLPCDTPWVDPELFWILARQERQFDVVVPGDSQRRVHPLCGIYKRSCLKEVRQHVEAGRLAVEALLRSPRLRVRVVEAGEHGFPDRIFRNINTPEDWKALD